MDCKNGTLVEQLDLAAVPYTQIRLNMGATTAIPCYLIHYTTKSNDPMTVLVVPQTGIDSWAENYYHFPYMAAIDAQELDWLGVYEHVHSVWWETALARVQTAQYCPVCNAAPVLTYEDIRGQKRCGRCHAQTSDNRP